MARTKYSEHFCAYCNKVTRMVLVGEMQNAQEKIWYRCSRCHHMTLLNAKTSEQDDGLQPIDIKTVTLYNPQLSFKVGEAIFHGDLNDVGRVVNKVRTSDGSQAIVVAFEKQGQKTLIENVKLNGELASEV
jgi:hypothetical protein